MSRSFLSQALQVDASAAYDDAVSSVHGAGVAEAQTNIEGDLNVLRTLMKNMLGRTNWYDAAEMTIQAIADKYFIQRITPAGFDNQTSGTGTSTAGFDTAIKTITSHNDGGGSSIATGVIVDATKAYRVAIRNATTKDVIEDGSGNEVYGRLSWNGSSYILSWYSNIAGVETAYDFTTAMNIDVAFVAVSRRYEDLDWSQFLDPSWHDVAGISGTVDDSNVTTGPWSYLLNGLTTQQQVNQRVDNLGSTANGEGASRIAIEDETSWYTGTDIEAAFAELKNLIGSTTSATYNFTEDNVLADNDSVYAALNKLDLKWGDLASVTNGEGASLVGVEDSGSFFTGTDVESVLQEIGQLIEDVSGWVKVQYTTTSPITVGTNFTIPGSNTYTMASGANMDVYLDGQLLTEGSGNDYTEVSTTQIAFAFTVPTGKNITIMIRK